MQEKIIFKLITSNKSVKSALLQPKKIFICPKMYLANGTISLCFLFEKNTHAYYKICNIKDKHLYTRAAQFC